MAIPANTIRHAMASRRITPVRLVAPAGAFCSTVLLRFPPGDAPVLTQGAWRRAVPSALTLHSALQKRLELCTRSMGGQPWRFAAGNRTDWNPDAAVIRARPDCRATSQRIQTPERGAAGLGLPARAGG